MFHLKSFSWTRRKRRCFEFIDYSSSLILSAPHATRSFCNKKKNAQIYILVRLLSILGL